MQDKMEKNIRVLVADDHPAFREGLARLIEDEEDIECVARCSDGAEAIKLATELKPDVAIIDVSMPNINGIDAVKQIKVSSPNTFILMVSAFDYEAFILASLRAGASGYITKNTSLSELVSAIRLICNGDSVFDSKATSKIVQHLSTEKGSTMAGCEYLQPREIEVLKLIAKGMSNKEVAGELLISERTVQTHLVNTFRKLGVQSRTQAVLYGLIKGWLILDSLRDQHVENGYINQLAAMH